MVRIFQADCRLEQKDTRLQRACDKWWLRRWQVSLRVGQTNNKSLWTSSQTKEQVAHSMSEWVNVTWQEEGGLWLQTGTGSSYRSARWHWAAFWVLWAKHTSPPSHYKYYLGPAAAVGMGTKIKCWLWWLGTCQAAGAYLWGTVG